MKDTTDIFLWANQIDAIKNELLVEFFLFNKNYTPYSTNMSERLDHAINPIFLLDLINTVSLGAGNGMAVRNITEASTDKLTLAHSPIKAVGRAETLIHLIENEREDIVEFNADEHGFKRTRGIVARYFHPTQKDVVFYVVKELKPSTVISGPTAWTFDNGKFQAQEYSASLKMPTDNQVLIVGRDIFAFNVSKFEAIFQYKAKVNAVAMEKGAILDKHFKLSMPTTIKELAHFTGASNANTKKLSEVDTNSLIEQDQVIEIVDNMQIELMQDDDGAIILMDSNDVGIFLDIINDNYVKGISGSYLAKKKLPLGITAKNKKGGK